MYEYETDNTDEFPEYEDAFHHPRLGLVLKHWGMDGDHSHMAQIPMDGEESLLYIRDNAPNITDYWSQSLIAKC
jgi:hypothetical protein